MHKQMIDGVWPTMITPFTPLDEVDYEALGKLVEWYIEQGVNGLFAVCQSSEMFNLSCDERVKIASFVKEKAACRVPVIASGHISDGFEDQVEELNRIASTGIDALVLITNRLATEEESDEVFRHNLEKLLQQIPEDIMLGFYECPYPYKRILSPELLQWCAQTRRFYFLKDTSCDTSNIERKLEAIQGTQLKIFNANSATLLDTLRFGVSGYSGIMANFHPKLYIWLVQNWNSQPDQAEQLINLLSMMSLIEKQLYPVNAKYYLMLEGILDHMNCRTKNHQDFTSANALEIEQLRQLSKQLAKQYVV